MYYDGLSDMVCETLEMTFADNMDIMEYYWDQYHPYDDPDWYPYNYDSYGSFPGYGFGDNYPHNPDGYYDPDEGWHYPYDVCEDPSMSQYWYYCG